MADMFSIFKASVDVADDSSLSELMGHGSAAVTQVRDEKCAVMKFRVAPSASQVAIDFSSAVTTGYRWALFSDYPIMYRTTGDGTSAVAATQKTLTSGNVSATNIGAPLPYQCFIMGTEKLTSLYVQPISGATTTANCKLVVAGDPTNSYT